MKCSLISPISLKRCLVFPILLFSSISLNCLHKKAFFSLLFSRTLHSVGHVFPFLPCLWFLFSSHLFVRPPQTTTLPSCISFSLAHYTVNFFFLRESNILHSVINVEYLLLHIIIFYQSQFMCMRNSENNSITNPIRRQVWKNEQSFFRLLLLLLLLYILAEI